MTEKPYSSSKLSQEKSLDKKYLKILKNALEYLERVSAQNIPCFSEGILDNTKEFYIKMSDLAGG